MAIRMARNCASKSARWSRRSNGSHGLRRRSTSNRIPVRLDQRVLHHGCALLGTIGAPIVTIPRECASLPPAAVAFDILRRRSGEAVRMSKRLKNTAFYGLCIVTAAALSGCNSMPDSLRQMMPSAAASTAPAPETTAAAPSSPAPVAASAPAAATPAPDTTASVAPAMTREKASTDCWMKYEKEGRGLSLDQRLPLVEKCTADKLKTSAAH